MLLTMALAIGWDEADGLLMINELEEGVGEGEVEGWKAGEISLEGDGSGSRKVGRGLSNTIAEEETVGLVVSVLEMMGIGPNTIIVCVAETEGTCDPVADEDGDGDGDEDEVVDGEADTEAVKLETGVFVSLKDIVGV